jgi:hypothetical protein
VRFTDVHDDGAVADLAVDVRRIDLVDLAADLLDEFGAGGGYFKIPEMLTGFAYFRKYSVASQPLVLSSQPSVARVRAHILTTEN